MLIKRIFPRKKEMIEITNYSRLLQSCGLDKVVMKHKVIALIFFLSFPGI